MRTNAATVIASWTKPGNSSLKYDNFFQTYSIQRQEIDEKMKLLFEYVYQKYWPLITYIRTKKSFNKALSGSAKRLNFKNNKVT